MVTQGRCLTVPIASPPRNSVDQSAIKLSSTPHSTKIWLNVTNISACAEQGYRDKEGLYLESDADEQILLHIPFQTGQVFHIPVTSLGGSFQPFVGPRPPFLLLAYRNDEWGCGSSENFNSPVLHLWAPVLMNYTSASEQRIISFLCLLAIPHRRPRVSVHSTLAFLCLKWIS